MKTVISNILNAFISLVFIATIIMVSQYDKVDSVINNTINIEGGYSNHAGDKGGATKFGITLATYRQLVNKDATIADFQAISINEARQFYKEKFFYKYNIQDLPESIWDIMFDMTVNHGPANAFTILQLALTKIGCKVAPDGVGGPATVAATAQACNITPAGLRTAVISQRVSFYAMIIRHKPNQKAFAAGWFQRCATFVDKNVLG